MDYNKFKNIPGYGSWVNIEVLNKGWSDDKKFVITDDKNDKYLLRISDISLYEDKKKQFELLKKVEELEINASRAVSFGKLNDNEIYMVLTWLEGEDAEIAIAKLSDEEAYKLGIETGKTLYKLHQIEVDLTDELDWKDKYKKKIEKKFKALENSIIEVPDKELLIEYINSHLYLMDNRKQGFTHGDFHVGNLIVNEGKIGVIDFDKNKIVDLYDDFKPFYWNVFISEYFQTGIVNGYFNNNIPSDFFPVLALYAADKLISFLPWAALMGKEELERGYQIHESIMKWYDNMRLTIPTWYKGILNF